MPKLPGINHLKAVKTLCAILVLCIFAFGCSGPGFAYRIPTENMSPNINPDDLCTANPFAYMSDSPKRFDIVVFNAPEGITKSFGMSSNTKYTSRVIGLPGEKIEIKRGVVYINDQELTEPFTKFGDDMDFRSIVIPENEYFLLGDNRPESLDSRLFKPATVKKADITGKITQVYPGYYKKN